MITAWKSIVEKNDEKEFMNAFQESKKFRLFLLKYIETKLEWYEETRETDYDVNNWALKRADRDGFLRSLKIIATLLKDTK